MAAPSVTVGLTTINTAETTTGWSNITGGGALNNEGDYYVQGSFSVSRTVSNTLRGFQYTAGSHTFAADEHAYIWMYLTGYPAADTTANGGVRMYLSDGGTTNRKEFYVDGNENLTGGWRCYVATPFNTGAVNNWAGFTNTVGGFGVHANIAQNVGKANVACDVIRVGTGLIASRGESTNAIGIRTVTSVNDSNVNQFGVFAATDTGARLQGRLSIGIDDTTTDTYFEDQNRVISVPNKNPLSEEASPFFNTLSNFTGIKVQGGLTTCILSNFTFISADLYDKGYFDCGSATNSPGNVDLDGCVFAKWGTTTLSANTTATNTTWINCEAITLNTGTLDNCTIETGIGGTYVFAGSTPNNISNTSFIGVNTTDTSATGYGHALEVTASGSYDFTNNTFVGFDTTGSDGAAIHIKGSGVTATFNITGNDATASPTYKISDGANTPVFNAAVTVNVTGLPVTPDPQDATEIRVLIAGQDLFATSAGIGTTNPDDAVGIESSRTSTFSFGMAKDAAIDLRIINLDYIPQFISSITCSNDPTNIASNMKLDRVSQNDKQ